MRSSDQFLQAKAVSQMQKNGAFLSGVIDVAVKQAFHHSEMAHRDFQAIYEILAICDSIKLSETFDSRE
ncbi:MAG: hypothetical protein MK132_17570 [Lentisphaerales bacterium]|nr:hypothetical protein [Lentisphaerales bacterium]